MSADIFFYHIAVCILVRRTHQLLKHSLQALSSDILNGCNHALELVWNARNARSKQADWAQRKLMSFQRLSVLPELRLSIFSSKECSYLLREGFLLSQIIFLPLGQQDNETPFVQNYSQQQMPLSEEKNVTACKIMENKMNQNSCSSTLLSQKSRKIFLRCSFPRKFVFSTQ